MTPKQARDFFAHQHREARIKANRWKSAGDAATKAMVSVQHQLMHGQGTRRSGRTLADCLRHAIQIAVKEAREDIEKESEIAFLRGRYYGSLERARQLLQRATEAEGLWRGAQRELADRELQAFAAGRAAPNE